MNGAPSHDISHLLLLDPELGNAGGHYASYAGMIERACSRLGIRFSSLGGHGSASPAFDGMNAQWVPSRFGGAIVNPIVGSWRMRSQLRTHATPKVSRETLVFAATANHRHYPALAGWLGSLGESVAPKLAILLRFPQYDSTRRRWYATAHPTRLGLARLERIARAKQVRLVADSETLADEYSRLIKRPVTVLPIPHMLAEGRSRMRAGAVMRIGYFGEARREKRFDVLVEAIKILAKSNGGGMFELVVQSYVRPGFEEIGCVAACASLEAGQFAHVRVLGTLDPDRFYEEFLACDAVLMPYDAERYRTRNSGIFTDAVAAGIAVIATARTWMDDQLRRGCGAGLTVPDGDAAALADAILAIARGRDAMMKKAESAAAQWRASHDPVAFVNGLVNLYS